MSEAYQEKDLEGSHNDNREKDLEGGRNSNRERDSEGSRSSYRERPAGGENKANLYVGNLPWTTKEHDIQDLFATYGELKSVKLVTDRATGRFRGYAFVEFVSVDAAAKAIDACNGKEFGFGVTDIDRDNKRMMHVKIAAPPEARPRTNNRDSRERSPRYENSRGNEGYQDRSAGPRNSDNKRSYNNNDRYGERDNRDSYKGRSDNRYGDRDSYKK